MDLEIAQSIEENLVPWSDAWRDLQPSELLHADAYQQVLPQYTKAVWQYTVSLLHLDGSASLHIQKSTAVDWQKPRPFIYTPLHGVGGLVFPDFCRSVGIDDFTAVAEQLEPNPDFPTVSFPNPEEAGALDLSMQTADREGKDLIIANDPDADRFAAAEKIKWVTPS